MPTIFVLDSIKILIYFDDHSPPHFHAIYSEYEEIILIPTMESLRGKLPANQRKKLELWADINMEFIVEMWNEFNPENRI